MTHHRGRWAVIVLASLLLPGCTGAPPQPAQEPGAAGPDRSLPLAPAANPAWWHWVGIQCERTPWEAWAEELAVQSEQAPAQDPYERSAPQEEEMRRYFDDHAFEYDHAWAYRDEATYDAACGSPDGWHYWTYTADVFPREDEGWLASPDGPPAAIEDGQA